MKKYNICLLSFVCGLVLFLLFIGIGVYRFGGVTQLFASINGESVVFSPKVLNLGHCKPDTEALAVFKMTNLSSKEISVVSERTSCDCAMPEGPPIFIPSGQTVDIIVKVRLPQYDFLYSQTAIFMVAEPNKRKLLQFSKS